MATAITTTLASFTGDLTTIAAVAVEIGAAACSFGWASALLQSSRTVARVVSRGTGRALQSSRTVARVARAVARVVKNEGSLLSHPQSQWRVFRIGN